MAAGAVGSSKGGRAFTVSFQSEYGDRFRAGYQSYPFLKDTHLVEPMRKTKVLVKPSAGRSAASCTVAFKASEANKPSTPYDDIASVPSLASFTQKVELSPDGDEGDGAFSGHVTLPQPSTYQATVTCELAFSSGANAATTAVSQVETVESMYVRRELRRLTDEDRNDFFDVLVYLYKVTNEEAIAEYGPAATSMHKLLSSHLSLSVSDMHLDHLHGGLGFLTHHTALTSRAEFAMQAINPRVTMPYWDYTIDSQMMKQQGVKTLSSSIVFTKDWFGALDTEEHTVTEGRFAYLKVPQQTTNGTDSGFPVSPYGYLRGPWNLNESPYLTRFVGSCGNSHEFAMPSCGAALELVLNTDTWVDTGNLIKQNSIHDGAHLYAGGVGGECTDIAEKIKEVVGSNVTRALIQTMPAMMQWMWRVHILKPPLLCSPGIPCAFTCTNNVTVATILIEELLGHYGFAEEAIEWKNNTRQHEAFDMLFCQTKVILGDAVDAGGAVDPTFWPIHPTLERLYQFKTLVNPLKSLYWPSGGVSSNEFDDDDTPCDTIWYSSNCKSHHSYDTTAFSALQKDSTGNYARSLPTNKDLLHSFSPANGGYAMPYIYEDFKWDHCELDGFRFPSV